MQGIQSRTWLVCVALMATVTTAVAAHDFWIEPSTFEPAIGEPVGIHLRVGERFVGDPVTRNERRIERFVLAGPSGERKVIGRAGMDPAGLLRLETPGVWFVGYQSTPWPVELPAAAFEQYLREEGLEHIIVDRANRNESLKPGRERFSRSVKSLLRTAGAPGATGHDRELGMPLEFVLEADPAAAADPLSLRLLYDGRPLQGALVVAFRKVFGANGEGAEAARARTNEDGRVSFPVAPGTWLVKAVHMRRADAGSGADWESVWTSLTFNLP